jgi:lipid-A-disaccharide synthase
MSKTVFFSAGEPSGDQHAARLIEALTSRSPEIRTRGFGGPEMRAAGCEIELDLTAHAVVGILEVLPKLRQFFRFADQAEAVFASGQIDAVVLVDFPGFNWHIAKRAKKYGIPVYYYCPPQLWAWGGWRIKKMKATVDHVLAVLPIEESYYRNHGIETTFVGHPFFEEVAEHPLDPQVQIKVRNGSDQTAGPTRNRLIAVLPGSRSHEVQRNWPIMLAAMRTLSRSRPDVRFAVAAYRDKHLQFCQQSLSVDDTALPIDFYQGATSEIIDAAECAMMVSGSVSLELMARRTPAAVLYRVGWFLYAYGKSVVRVRSVTLPNLMMDQFDGNGDEEDPFPEMISVGDSGKAVRFLVESIERMLGSTDTIATEIHRNGDLPRRREQLDRLNAAFARTGASGRAAEVIIDLLSSQGSTSPSKQAA